MKHIIKKTNHSFAVAAFAMLFAFLCSACNVYAGAPAVSVYVNGEQLTFDVDPQIINGRTMVPLRGIFEKIGAMVKWDAETQTVSARKNAKTVSLRIDSTDLQIDKGDTDDNGNPITETETLDVSPQIVDGRTLIPLRAVSQAFRQTVDWDEDTRTVTVASEPNDDSWKENTGTVSLSDLTYTGEGISVSESGVTFTRGGDYTVEGKLEKGNITVNTEDRIKLRLNGVEIHTTEEPCIFVDNADKAFITLNENTQNYLYTESGKGAIYAKDNLEIKGKGSLNISATETHGIKASDSLSVEGGNITVTAGGDGIHVNDTFSVSDGILNINATGDGIDSESIVNIVGGTVNITTNGEAIVTENTQNTDPNMRFHGGYEETQTVEFAASTKGINAEWMMYVGGGEIQVESADHAIHCADELEIDGGNFTLTSHYGKGISAHGNFTVNGENTYINVLKSTEGLESKKTLTVNNGIIRIMATDDGINATGGNSGEMGFGGPRPNDMPPEGVDPMQNPPKNGQTPPDFMPPEDFDQTMRDETDRKQPHAQNRGDRNNPHDSAQPPMGEHSGKKLSDCLIINGGDIEIYAQDDCLDANGNMFLLGGIIKGVKTNGEFFGNNAVCDADGSITLSGSVTLIAAGGGGSQSRIETTQNTLTAYAENNRNANDTITLQGADGTTLLQYTPATSYSAVYILSPVLQQGQNYQVTLGEESFDVSMTQQQVTVGTAKNIGFGGGMGREHNKNFPKDQTQS